MIPPNPMKEVININKYLLNLIFDLFFVQLLGLNIYNLYTIFLYYYYNTCLPILTNISIFLQHF